MELSRRELFLGTVGLPFVQISYKDKKKYSEGVLDEPFTEGVCWWEAGWTYETPGRYNSWIVFPAILKIKYRARHHKEEFEFEWMSFFNEKGMNLLKQRQMHWRLSRWLRKVKIDDATKLYESINHPFMDISHFPRVMVHGQEFLLSWIRLVDEVAP